MQRRRRYFAFLVSVWCGGKREGADTSQQYHSLFLLLLCGCLSSGCALHSGGRGCELIDEVANEELGEVGQLVWLDLVIVIRVNRAEQRVDIFVSDGHSNVVTTEEVREELTKLTPVQVCVTVVVVLREVLLDLLSQLRLVIVELL